MPVFDYEAVDASGQVSRGQVVGSTLTFAAELLARRGLTVRSLQVAPALGQPSPTGAPNVQGASTATQGSGAATGAVPGMASPAPSASQTTDAANFARLVPLGRLAFFFQQSSSLLNAGITPYDAFSDLANKVKHGTLAAVCRDLRDAAYANQPLSPVLHRYPGAFSPYMVAMWTAGERGGFLPRACAEIAQYIQNEIDLRNRIRIATIYPKMLLAAALGVMLFMNDIARSVTGRNVYQSPLLQPGIWFVLAPILVGLFFFFRYATRLPAVKHAYDQVVILLPWFGTTAKMMAMAKFGRSFGSLYRAGVLPAESMEYAAQSCGNEAVRRRMMGAVEPLRAGQGVTAALASTGHYPDVLLQMMATGERTGELDKMLLQAADYFDAEAGVRAKQSAVVLGVVILMLVVLWIGSQIVGVLGSYGQQLQEVIAE